MKMLAETHVDENGVMDLRLTFTEMPVEKGRELEKAIYVAFCALRLEPKEAIPKRIGPFTFDHAEVPSGEHCHEHSPHCSKLVYRREI